MRQSVRVYEPLGTRRCLGLGGETKQLTALVFCLRSPVLTTHAKVRKACHKSSQQTNTTMRRPRKLTYRAKQRLPTSKHVGENILLLIVLYYYSTAASTTSSTTSLNRFRDRKTRLLLDCNKAPCYSGKEEEGGRRDELRKKEEGRTISSRVELWK